MEYFTNVIEWKAISQMDKWLLWAGSEWITVLLMGIPCLDVISSAHYGEKNPCLHDCPGWNSYFFMTCSLWNILQSCMCTSLVMELYMHAFICHLTIFSLCLGWLSWMKMPERWNSSCILHFLFVTLLCPLRPQIFMGVLHLLCNGAFSIWL